MGLYRLIMALLLPGLLGLTLVQRWRGRVGPRAVAQRLGFGPIPGLGPTLWLHGASNGELASARWVLERLLAALPGLQVLVTANTGTALRMVAVWGLPGVRVAMAPLDTAGAARRVLRRWRPRALILVESELWPARLAAAREAGVPVALIGGRLSVRSAASWARFAPGLLQRGLAGLAHVSAQDAGSAARLVALGLPADRLGPVMMLKAHGQSDGPADLPQPVPRDRVLLAASTHPGEEALLLDAFGAARSQFDLLILAPRHPRRGDEVARLIAARGWGFARRSLGAMPSARQPVFLADTLGEMAQWYAMAGVVVIGGSFVPLGGHTPYEPAAAGAALLHGPHMENFADAAAALARAGGAVQVDPADLAAALATLDADRQRALSSAAHSALTPDGDADALIATLVRLIG